MSKKERTLNGKPAVQMNVTVENEFLNELKKAGKLQFMTFSAYARKLMVEDLTRIN